MATLFCPNATVWRSSCKSRTCPVCGPPWARDQQRKLGENLAEYGGPVVMITITPPGADRLPWDEAHCAGRGRPGKPHRHSGKRGCRVQHRAAREWTETLTWRASRLRNAAMMAAERAVGHRPAYLGSVYEIQKRGVPHLHLVYGYGLPSDIAAARALVRAFVSLAPSYDFGWPDRKLRAMSSTEATKYLAHYLVGRSSGKPAIRELLEDPAMKTLLERGLDPRRGRRRMSLPLVWVTPKLSRRTLITMRTLRRSRHVYAALNYPDVPLPRWSSVEEAVKTGAVFRRLYQRRAPPDAAALEYALEWAKAIDPHVNLLNRQETGTTAMRAMLAMDAA